MLFSSSSSLISGQQQAPDFAVQLAGVRRRKVGPDGGGGVPKARPRGALPSPLREGRLFGGAREVHSAPAALGHRAGVGASDRPRPVPVGRGAPRSHPGRARPVLQEQEKEEQKEEGRRRQWGRRGCGSGC